jgi:hypothetical protein
VQCWCNKHLVPMPTSEQRRTLFCLLEGGVWVATCTAVTI